MNTSPAPSTINIVLFITVGAPLLAAGLTGQTLPMSVRIVFVYAGGIALLIALFLLALTRNKASRNSHRLRIQNILGMSEPLPEPRTAREHRELADALTQKANELSNKGRELSPSEYSSLQLAESLARVHYNAADVLEAK